MRERLKVRAIPAVIFILALCYLPATRAQDSEQLEGIDSGGYKIHQTIEAGYRFYSYGDACLLLRGAQPASRRPICA